MKSGEQDRSSVTRVLRPVEQARHTYNRMSPWYDFVEQPFEYRHKQRAIDVLDPRPGERILEPGCGTGNNLVAIARRQRGGGEVAGLDIAERMVERARRRVRQEGCGDRGRVVTGNALELPFPDGYFEAVFLSFTLELFDTPDIPRVLGECARVLTPEGRVVVVSLSRRKVNPAVRLYEWVHNHMPAQLDCRPIHPAQHLREAGYVVNEERRLSLAGIPVDLVRARRPPPPTS